MNGPVLIFGEQIDKEFFNHLLIDKDSKFLTEFKRYFNFLKKNHNDYKSVNYWDKVSKDKPIIDYINIVNGNELVL